MVDGGQIFRTVANVVNKGVVPLLRHGGPVGAKLKESMAEVTYTGRKSGKEFTLVVGYRREGDTVTIGCVMPDAKTWWRNFLGEGAPMRLTLGDSTYDAHAVATRDADGTVIIQAQLASPR